MKTKAKGNRREHRCMHLLESQGYSCTRSSASLGAWDVIAIRKDGVRLIQVKSNRWPRSPEMAQLEEFEAPPGVTKEIWRYDDRKRNPLVKVL